MLFELLFQAFYLQWCNNDYLSCVVLWTKLVLGFLVCLLGMVDTMHNIFLVTIKHVIQKARFINISCDEVTIVDNQSSISIHYYVVENF
jgi:hypothetical protein